MSDTRQNEPGAAGPGESKAGESKAGESKAGESKAGESKAGESKAGESKAGESKAGEARAEAPRSPDASQGAEPGKTAEPGSPAARAPREAASATRTAPDDSGDLPGPGDGGPRMSRRTMLILVLAAVSVAVIAAMWIAGSQNARSYYLDCGVHKATAKRGRSFPPWGTQELSGPAWAPIELILPMSVCDDLRLSSEKQLEARYRAALVTQADTWLGSLRLTDPRDHLDTVQRQLEQALLLSRASDGDSLAARERIGRLLGDVEYWRAHNELLATRTQLGVAIERLDAAVDRDPVHARAAGEWREFLAHTMRELEAGPLSQRPAPVSPRDPDDARSPPAREPGDPDTTPGVPVAPEPGAPEPGAPEPGLELPEVSSDGPDLHSEADTPDVAPGQALPADDPAHDVPLLSAPAQGSGTLL